MCVQRLVKGGGAVDCRIYPIHTDNQKRPLPPPLCRYLGIQPQHHRGREAVGAEAAGRLAHLVQGGLALGDFSRARQPVQQVVVCLGVGLDVGLFCLFGGSVCVWGGDGGGYDVILGGGGG